MKKLFSLSLLVVLVSVLALVGCATATPAAAPADKSTGAPAGKSADAPADKSAGAPADKSTAAPADKSTAAPAAKSTEPWGGIKYIRISGPAVGTMGAQVFAIMAAYWSKIPGIQASVFPETARAAWDLDEGKFEVGQMINYQYLSWKKGEYLPQGAKAISHVRHFQTMTNSIAAIVVRADSKIRTLEDLKSARIAGLLGNGPLATRDVYDAANMAILQAVGITPENIGKTGGKITSMGMEDTASALRDGTIDAWLAGGSVAGPMANLNPLEQTSGLRLIPVPQDILEKARQILPQFQAISVDWSGSIKSQQQPFSTLGTYINVVVRDSLPDDLVYEMAKQLFDTAALPDIRKIAKSQWTKHTENARIGSDVWEVHPGALKYYKEKNVPVRDSFLVAP